MTDRAELARAAADVAALYPPDSPLARIARQRLAELAEEEKIMPDTVRIGGPLRDLGVRPRPEDTPVQVGTPLRDAAVDPQPEDFLPPINAGKAHPHSPQLVAVEVDTELRLDAIDEHRKRERGTGA